MADARSDGINSNSEEFARRGDALYDKRVRPNVTPGDKGKFAAIDVETGDYEIDADDLAAVDRLLNRHPTASVWLTRVGLPYAYRLGWRNELSAP